MEVKLIPSHILRKPTTQLLIKWTINLKWPSRDQSTWLMRQSKQASQVKKCQSLTKMRSPTSKTWPPCGTTNLMAYSVIGCFRPVLDSLSFIHLTGSLWFTRRMMKSTTTINLWECLIKQSNLWIGLILWKSTNNLEKFMLKMMWEFMFYTIACCKICPF